MRESYVFVSDLHIAPGGKEGVKRFSGFLDALKQQKVARLYVLGDLFDFWVGPGHENQPEYRSTLTRIRELVDSGVAVYLFHGNRDFFVNSDVARITGATIAGQQMQLQLGDKTVRLCHGDQLCRDDWSYQALRKLLRSSPFRVVYQSCPFFVREFLGRKLRDISKRSTANKPEEVVGFSARAIESIFDRGVDVLVCGHIHKRGEMSMHYNDCQHVLYTVGDWSADGSYLLYRKNKFELLRYEW